MGYNEELRKLKKKQKYERERLQLLKKISDETDYLNYKIKQMWENNPLVKKERRRRELCGYCRDGEGEKTHLLPDEDSQAVTEEERTRQRMKEDRRRQLFNRHVDNE